MAVATAAAAARPLRSVLLLAALSAAFAQTDCVADPTDPACASFALPASTVVADLNSLCSAMHFMTGCSLYKACNATSRPNVGADPTICEPFQQLATICAKDPGMGGMGGCARHYRTMCAAGSVVPQCRRYSGLDLISTEDANKWVRSICEEMDMEGCERCTPAWQEGKKWGGPNCDPFAVYGWLCVQMPDMWQCVGPGSWAEVCRKDPTLYACVGDAPALTDLARAVMAFTTTALSYALMLAAMSFHVAIFFAVCAGVGAGAGLFGRYRARLAAAHESHCCG